MPKTTFNEHRQRACAYVHQMNPHLGPDQQESTTPDLLFSFMGRRCHAVRDAIFTLSHPRGFLEDTSRIQFFGADGPMIDAEKKRYADVVKRSKFVLCPRGAGPTSFRLFETMAAGRVPVILGDEWVPPFGPQWSNCSIQVAESEVKHVPEIIEAQEGQFPGMAKQARAEWEAWFAPAVRFHRMVESCADILRNRQWPEAVSQRLPNFRKLRLRGRRVKAMLRDAMQRKASPAAR